MVARNKHFAPENPHTVEENRVGIFLAKARNRVGQIGSQLRNRA